MSLVTQRQLEKSVTISANKNGCKGPHLTPFFEGLLPMRSVPLFLSWVYKTLVRAIQRVGDDPRDDSLKIIGSVNLLYMNSRGQILPLPWPNVQNRAGGASKSSVLVPTPGVFNAIATCAIDATIYAHIRPIQLDIVVQITQETFSCY